MTEVGGKSRHKPSAKHALEEVRKSLEDLVRNEFEHAAPAPEQVNAGAAVRQESTGATSTSRIGTLENLDTAQLVQSLNDLLGSELEDVQPEQADSAEEHSGPSLADAKGADDSDASEERVASRAESSDQPSQLSPAENSNVTAADEQPLVAESAEIPAPIVPVDADADTGSDTAEPEAVAPAEIPSGQDTGEITLEAFAAQLEGAETEEVIDLESATPDAADLEAQAPEIAPLEGAERHEAEQPDEADRADADTETVDLADLEPPESEKVEASSQAPDAVEQQAASAPSNVGVLEVIDVPSATAPQLAFTFEDPTLGLTVETREITTGSTEPDTPAVDTGQADSNAQGVDRDARQSYDSDLGLESVSDANAEGVESGGDAISPVITEEARSKASAPTEVEMSSTQASSTKDVVASDARVLDEAATAGDALTAEEVAESFDSMDALEIPGGDQLSEEVTAERPPAAPVETPKDEELVVLPVADDTQDAEPQATKTATEEGTFPSAESPRETREESRPADEKRRPRKKVVAAVPKDETGSLKMPTVDFDSHEGAEESRAVEFEVQATPDTPYDKETRPTLTLSDSGPLLTRDTDAQTLDSEFIELGGSAADSQTPLSKTPLSLETESAATLSSPTKHREETPRQTPSTIPRDLQSKSDTKTRTPSSSAEGAGETEQVMNLDLSKPLEKSSPAGGAEPGWGKIPVLDDVVAQPNRGTPGPALPAKKSPPPAAKPVSGKKAATQRTKAGKTPRVSAQNDARARSLAVQVVAKLNMELRKCGERALSPTTIDRLQYLLREALAQKTSNVHNTRKTK